MDSPKDALMNGVLILQAVLEPHGFQFLFGGESQGSGGEFAWGEFVRGDRKLELHFRNGLGMVRYHAAVESAGHESYMRELGVKEQCQYPGFSNDPAEGFQHLAHDLAMAEDFLSGDASALRRAASMEAAQAAERTKESNAIAVGDTRVLAEMTSQFGLGHFGEVLRLLAELKYPEQMNASEQRMVELARVRAGDASDRNSRSLVEKVAAICQAYAQEAVKGPLGSRGCGSRAVLVNVKRRSCGELMGGWARR